MIQTGHYTRNISEALKENHDELKALVAEKVKQDPNVRLIGRLPGYDTIVSEVSEVTINPKKTEGSDLEAGTLAPIDALRNE